MEILRRYANGAELKAIATELGVDQEVVNEVASAVGFQRPRARELLREHDVAVARARATPTTAPLVAVRNDIEGILARAEHIGGRIGQHAARIRTAVTDLERHLAAHAEIAVAQAEVDRLQAALAEATEKLRKAKAPLTADTPVPPPGPIVDFKAVRRWAAANSVECPSAGRVPNKVIAAYREATGAAA